MEVTELREKLYSYIRNADEAHLSALYDFAEENGASSNDGFYDEAMMKMLYERRENHRKGISKSYTADESINLIRQSRK